MRPLVTGSGIERVALCEASAVLPHVGSVTNDASRGQVIHSFLEAVPKMGREAALDAVPEEIRPFCEALPLERLPTDPRLYAAEVAFAFDTATGKAREIGRGIGRRYEVSETEIPGTCDVVALVEDDAVLVDDYKSGWSQRPKASQSLQLRFYGLAAARAYGRSRAIVRMTRLMEDGEVYTDEATLDAFDLDSFALELCALASQIEGARRLFAEGVEPSMTEGGHCRWCPAFARCPAKTALVMAPPSVEITPAGAAQAYERLRLYKQAIEKAEEILKDYARANPIPLPDGRVYGPRYDLTKVLDGKVAASALRDLFGEAAEEAISVEVTQAGIERAARAYLAATPGLTLKAAKERALEAIRQRGGLKTVQAPKLVAHKPKAEAA